MKQRILFVDDEQRVLDGLNRSFYREQDNWDMTFVISGAEALEQAKKQHFDAVVSDMVMPKMNGAQLLQEIGRLYPDTVRIILSGYSNTELAIKSVGIAHQYLNKPCALKDLKSALSRAFALREVLGSDKLRGIITGLKNIPSIPDTYRSLTELIESGETNFTQVSEVISQDPSMVARVLQLANSAFFGLGHNIASPSEAVFYLGFDVIRALALSDGIFLELTPLCRKISSFSPEILWRHSRAVGNLAREITKTENANEFVINCSYSAGILHDIGLMILVCNMREEWEQMIAVMASGLNIGEAEDKVLGARHETFGACLLGLWGLPEEIVHAVAFQHQPSSDPHRGFSPMTAVHIASALCSNTAIDLDYLQRIGLDDRLDNWRTHDIPAKEQDFYEQ